MKSDISTYSEFAEEIGVDAAFMGVITRALAIVPKPVPRSPNAKGLDGKDRAAIRRSLRLRLGEKVVRPPKSGAELQAAAP